LSAWSHPQSQPSEAFLFPLICIELAGLSLRDPWAVGFFERRTGIRPARDVSIRLVECAASALGSHGCSDAGSDGRARQRLQGDSTGLHEQIRFDPIDSIRTDTENDTAVCTQCSKHGDGASLTNSHRPTVRAFRSLIDAATTPFAPPFRSAPLFALPPP
jgi:hypothetical protein